MTMTDAEREAGELAGMDLPETDVAVVVFVRAPGMDDGDARDRAVASVQRALVGASVDGIPIRLPVLHRGHLVPGLTASVATVTTVNRAMANGLLHIVPTRTVR